MYKITYNELNIYEIENFHRDILNSLEAYGDIFELDFEDVSKIDLNSVQLLISLKKYCDEQNIKLKLINISTKQIKQILKMYNLTDYLGV